MSNNQRQVVRMCGTLLAADLNILTTSTDRQHTYLWVRDALTSTLGRDLSDHHYTDLMALCDELMAA